MHLLASTHFVLAWVVIHQGVCMEQNFFSNFIDDFKEEDKHSPALQP